MKIKLTAPIGSILADTIIDAAVAPDKLQAYVYDPIYQSTGFYVYAGQFEVIQEQKINSQTMSIRDLIGQDLARIEFK